MANENEKGSAEPHLRTIDSKYTPTIFVDGVHGMQYREDVVFVNLTRRIYGVPGSDIEGDSTEAVARLAIPIRSYLRIVNFMYESLTVMENEGVLKKDEPENG